MNTFTITSTTSFEEITNAIESDKYDELIFSDGAQDIFKRLSETIKQSKTIKSLTLEFQNNDYCLSQLLEILKEHNFITKVIYTDADLSANVTEINESLKNNFCILSFGYSPIWCIELYLDLQLTNRNQQLAKKIIEIENNNVDIALLIAYLDKINFMGSIVELTLTDCLLDEQAQNCLINLIKRNLQLTKVVLTGNKLTDAFVEKINSESLTVGHQLKTLNLSNNQLTAKSLCLIRKFAISCQQLKEINLQNNPIVLIEETEKYFDKFIDELSVRLGNRNDSDPLIFTLNEDSENEVSISINSNFDLVIYLLTKGYNFRSLTLGRLTEKQLERLLDVLATNTSVKTVEINQMFSQEECQKIQNKLRNNFCIQKFFATYYDRVSCVHKTDDIMQEIAKRNIALKKSYNTSKLNKEFVVSNIDLHNTKLSNYFEINKINDLTGIALRNCQLQDGDANEILRIIKSNPSLRIVNLSGNKFSDQFIEAFAGLTKRSHADSDEMDVDLPLQSLQFENLIFSGNSITAKALEFFNGLLESSPTLRQIYLQNNPLQWDEQLFSLLLEKIDKEGTAQAMDYRVMALEEIKIKTTQNCTFNFSYSNEIAIKLIELVPFRILCFTPHRKEQNHDQKIWHPINFVINTDNFFQRLIAVLKNSKSINTLRLWAVKQQEEGIRLLINSLNEYPTLAHLSLPAFYVVKVEKLHFNKGQSWFNTLKYMSSDSLPTVHFTTLINKLSDNKTLVSLNLDRTEISGSVKNTFIETINQNHILTSLFFRETQFTANDIKKILIVPENKKTKNKKNKEKYNHNTSLTRLVISRPACYRVKRDDLIDEEEFKLDVKTAIETFEKENQGYKDLLISAVITGKLKEVRQQLKSASVYCQNDDGTEDYLLHVAVRCKRVDIVKELVETYKYNLALTNKAGETALELAETLRKKNPNTVDQNLDAIIELLKNPGKAPKLTTMAAASNPTKKTTPNKKRKAEVIIKTETDDTASVAMPAPAAKRQKLVEADDDQIMDDEDVQASVQSELIDNENELDELIKSILNQANDLQTQHVLLKKIYEFVITGAVFDNSLFPEVVANGHYRLMKILLHSPHCHPDIKNKDNKTAFDIAVLNQDILIVERLLIDRRVSRDTLDDAFNWLANKEPVNFNLLALLQRHKKTQLPEKRAGIHWVKHFSLLYGSSFHKAQKRISVNCDKEHAYLAQQNSFTRKHAIQALPSEDTKAELDKLGNPVTASLVFILSDGKYVAHQVQKRIKIRIALDFKQHHHVSENQDEEDLDNEKNSLMQRAANAPEEAFARTFTQRTRKALTPEDIDDKFTAYRENNDPGFYQLLRHGEQSLLDDLEQRETIQKIAQQLFAHPKFIAGCKVYAVILNIHTPRYPCENCEIGILGEQNVVHSKFLNQFQTLLTYRGCALPVFSPLRMITLVSSYLSHDSCNPINEESHADLLVDIRSCQNNLILARDESAFTQTQLTQYHSNKSNSYS